MMPYKTNAEVKKVKGADKYSDSQLTAFRSAFNSVWAAKMRDDVDKDAAESAAFAAGHAAAKKVKHELIKAQLEGYAKKLIVGVYNKEDKVYEGDALWYCVDDETWKTYIMDGLELVAILSSWESIEFVY